jgi:hypothetical protein
MPSPLDSKSKEIGVESRVSLADIHHLEHPGFHLIESYVAMIDSWCQNDEPNHVGDTNQQNAKDKTVKTIFATFSPFCSTIPKRVCDCL